MTESRKKTATFSIDYLKDAIDKEVQRQADSQDNEEEKVIETQAATASQIPAEKIIRCSIDIPVSLHRRIQEVKYRTGESLKDAVIRYIIAGLRQEGL